MNKQFSTNELNFGFYLTNEVFNGRVFGEVLDMGKVPPQRLSNLFHEVHCLSAEALLPLAQYQPQLVKHILDKTILKSVAFISAVAYELLVDSDDLYALDKAGAAMALVQIADHLMDRGDAKMVTALESFFGGKTSEDAEVQARIAILDAIADLSYQCSFDEGDLLADSMLAILRDELHVFQLSKCFDAIKDEPVKADFLHEMSGEIAALSIRNGGLRPGTYMVYSCYRQVCPELPTVQELSGLAALEPLNYFGEWAIRLWDDFGDQELDASQGVYTNAYIINPFVLQDERLTAAYLQEIDSEAEYDALVNAMHSNDRAVNQLVASVVSKISHSLPESLESNHGIYLAILRRIIEAGYVNSRGDEEISYSTEVISDYA